MNHDENKTLTDLEWEQRTLCSDESCIGVIGTDGRCKDCGLPYSGVFNSVKEDIVTPEVETTMILKRRMVTEEDSINEQQEAPSENPLKQRLQSAINLRQQIPQQTSKQISEQQIFEDEIIAELETLKRELERICFHPLLWKKWLTENGYSDAIGMHASEAIPAILDDMYEKAMAYMSGDSY